MKVLGTGDHAMSLSTIHLCHGSMKAAIDHMNMAGFQLNFTKTSGKCVRISGYSLPTPETEKYI